MYCEKQVSESFLTVKKKKYVSEPYKGNWKSSTGVLKFVSEGYEPYKGNWKAFYEWFNLGPEFLWTL